MADESPQFTHLDERGEARMVDVSAKPATRRVARASCRIALSDGTVDRLSEMPKGDALAVARLAGIQAAKRTAEWIPLAHPLPIEKIAIDFRRLPGALSISSEIVVTARTGAEMEALVACSAAALALYDMVKAVERGATITDLRLDAKSGGKSGDWERER